MKKLLTYLFISFCVMAEAQHYQFSQFYAAQIYLNPAFTGAGSCQRVSLNYRNQWSKIPGGFTTYQLAYDRALKQYNSGLGCVFFSDQAGPGQLKSTMFNLLYAYELKINKGLVARAGISSGFTQRSIDYSALTFGDQIARGGASGTVEDVSTTRSVYFDMNLGGLVYTKNAWGGIAVNHVTRPNQSLMGGNSPLPIECKFHGGYKYEIDEDANNAKEEHSITAAINYKFERKFNQIDLGAYYHRGYFILGMWYRGIPLYRPVPYYRNNDALIFLVGVATEKVNIGYSYDFTISRLNLANTNGTHEISISYPFCGKKKRKKKPILISCPKF